MCYIFTESPSSNRQVSHTFGALFHKHPDWSLERVFGSKAYVSLEKKEVGLTKFGLQSESGISLGMEPNTKAYRVLIGNEIRVSRHVVIS